MNEASNKRLQKGLWLIWAVLLPWSGPGFAYVTDDGWELASGKNDDPLVYTKVIDGQSIKAIKAVTTLDVPLKTLLTVLADAELVPEWIPVIGNAELLQDTDPSGTSITYMVTKFPWPIRNRDAVVSTVTEYDQNTNTITMVSSGLTGYVEIQDGIIRTPTTYTRWKIQPQDDGQLHVEIITHSDPLGRIPRWLMNIVITRTPKTMFTRLTKTVNAEEERNRPFNEVHVFGKEAGF
jgi:hypothetical protein